MLSADVEISTAWDFTDASVISAIMDLAKAGCLDVVLGGPENTD